MSVSSDSVMSDLLWLLPEISTTVPCPNKFSLLPVITDRTDTRSFYCPETCEGPLYGMIPHLNDQCGWTREQIADWLDTLDLELAFPAEPPPRPVPPLPIPPSADFVVAVDPAVDQDTVIFVISSPKTGKAYCAVPKFSKPVYIDAETISKTAETFSGMLAAFKEFNLKFNPSPQMLQVLFGGSVKSSGNPCAEAPPLPQLNKNKSYPQPKLSKKEKRDGRRRSRH